MELSVRLADVDDADDVGVVHVRAWQAAYRGIMPDSYLDGLRIEQRAEMWRRSMTAPRRGQQLRVAVVDGRVVGFAASGPEAGHSPTSDVGELYSLNVDPGQWRRGLGRALLDEVTSGLADAGYRSAVLWVATVNDRARALYESAGWVDDGRQRAADVLGVTVREARYRRHVRT